MSMGWKYVFETDCYPPTLDMLYALKMPHRGFRQKETTSLGRKKRHGREEFLIETGK